MQIRVLIADDHAIMREGLRLILAQQSDISVVGEARNGREAVALAEALVPDILLLDISMNELNGIDVAKILRSLPAVRIIMLSMHNTAEYISRALKAGARGYLIKDSVGTEVLTAIHCVINGRQFIGTGVEALPMGLSTAGGKGKKTPWESLSRRERETLQLVVEGKTSQEISQMFNISRKSVETYRSRLMQKLGVSNIPSLVKCALQNGVISL